MKSAHLAASAEEALDALKAQTTGTLVEDRFGDLAVLLEDGLWQFSETRPLPVEYIAKHYFPFTVLAVEPGDRIEWPESAISMPLDSAVQSRDGEQFTKTGRDSWREQSGAETSSRELLATHARLTALSA